MSSNDKAVSVLNDLIAVTNDGEAGFNNAAKHATGTEVRTLFSAYAQRCAAGKVELQQLVKTFGGEPKTDGTIGGALHRGLTDVKASVTGYTDLALLEECERGEDVAKKAYKDALKEPLPSEVQLVVERQNAEVIAHHDRVRDLRDSYKAAKR